MKKINPDRIKDKLAWLGKNKEGKWAVIQWPNVLLSAWIFLLVINYFYHSQSLSHLQGAVLFAWAYNELTQGESRFRKILGAVILVIVSIGFFR